jgi:antitoxin MazE
MKIALVQIGNSKGVRLPKAVLEQVGLTEAAELTVENGRIVLTPAKPVRTGWAEAFAIGPNLTDEDREWLDAPLTEDEGHETL